MKLLRTPAQVEQVYKNLGIDPSVYEGVEFFVHKTLLQLGRPCDGLYLTNKILVRSIQNTQIFEFVCLHELGHHVHHTFMPNLTKSWTKAQKESFANSFAAGGYKQYIS